MRHFIKGGSFLHWCYAPSGRTEKSGFVETPRHTGAVYKASGWLRVGTTQGRGRYDRDKLYDKPKKDIWLRPLRKDWRRILNR